MGEQLAMQAVKTATYEIAADRLRDVVGQVIERLGAVEVAGTVGVTAQALHMALSGRENRSVRLDWLPALLAMDDERHLIRAICLLAGGDFVARKDRTPEQERDALRAQLEGFGPQGYAAIARAGL